MGEIRLTPEMRYTLYLTRQGLWGERPKSWKEWQNESQPLDWEQIQKLSIQMKLDPFVTYALKLGQGLDCPRQQYETWTGKIQQKAVGRVMAAQELHDFQKALENIGISSAVVKGIAAASAYPHPELREGCDIDLYVDEDDEQAVYDYVSKLGGKIEPRVKGTHHGEMIHPILGLIELHVSLCNADEALVEAAKAAHAVLIRPKSPFVTVDTLGNEIVTIDYTEHMLFLISHMINHYLHGEASLRHMIDVNAFYTFYQSRIDEVELQEHLKQLKYDRFFGIVLLIGESYLGYSYKLEMIEKVVGDRQIALQTAEELLWDYLQVMTKKEDMLRVYDEYCRETIPTGARSLAFKVRILEKNVRTAMQLRHRMSMRDMASIGVVRIRNLFLGNVTQDVDDTAKYRIDTLRKTGLL